MPKTPWTTIVISYYSNLFCNETPIKHSKIMLKFNKNFLIYILSLKISLLTVTEFWIDMYTLLHLKWITNKDLLYSAGKSAQSYVAAWTGGELGREWYMYIGGWVLLLFTWKCHSTVHQLYSKIKWKVKKKKKSLLFSSHLPENSWGYNFFKVLIRLLHGFLGSCFQFMVFFSSDLLNNNIINKVCYNLSLLKQNSYIKLKKKMERVFILMLQFKNLHS